MSCLTRFEVPDLSVLDHKFVDNFHHFVNLQFIEKFSFHFVNKKDLLIIVKHLLSFLSFFQILVHVLFNTRVTFLHL